MGKEIGREEAVTERAFTHRGIFQKVKVSYDAKNVNPAYIESSNLAYGQAQSVAVIHPNDNRWVNNLTQDLMSAMAPGAEL